MSAEALTTFADHVRQVVASLTAHRISVRCRDRVAAASPEAIRCLCHEVNAGGAALASHLT